MQTLTDQLSKYAAFHRDRRNIVTHFIGVPMIVLAVAALLSRPAWALVGSGLVLTPALILFCAATFYYLALDIPFGMAMGMVSAVSVVFGHWTATLPTPSWMAVGVGLFVIGWAFQFVGHIRYEHRKTCFRRRYHRPLDRPAVRARRTTVRTRPAPSVARRHRGAARRPRALARAGPRDGVRRARPARCEQPSAQPMPRSVHRCQVAAR